MAGRQADGAGRLHRVGRVVALDPVVRIVAEEVHRLAALEVDDPEHLSLSHDAGPRMTGAHHGIQDNPSVEGRRCRCALYWNAPPVRLAGSLDPPAPEIGRASCRERGCQYV